MSAFAYALLALLAQAIGWTCGRLARRRLPPEHLSTTTRDWVMLAVGMVGTLAALVLGLMISSAKSSFDADRASVTDTAAQILMIDRALAHYGDEAKPARDVLRQSLQLAIDKLISRAEPSLEPEGARQGPLPHMGQLQVSVLALPAVTENQRWMKARALTLAGDLERARVLFASHSGGSIPPAFLVVLTFWLAMLFVALALFAPENATATLTAVGAALAFAAAIFLILELDTPFHGIVRLSSEPLEATLELLGR